MFTVSSGVSAGRVSGGWGGSHSQPMRPLCEIADGESFVFFTNRGRCPWDGRGIRILYESAAAPAGRVRHGTAGSLTM
jgi:hypothetical protein